MLQTATNAGRDITGPTYNDKFTRPTPKANNRSDGYSTLTAANALVIPTTTFDKTNVRVVPDRLL